MNGRILFAIIATTLFIPALASAASQPAPATEFTIEKFQLLRYVLLSMAVLLLGVIAVLASAVSSASKMYWEKVKAARSKNPPATLLLLLMLFLPAISQAQEADTIDKIASAPLIPYDLYIFFVLVALEIAVTLALAAFLLKFLRKEELARKRTVKVFRPVVWWQQFSQARSRQEEEALDLHHDYDGIRELDNKVPSWWQYGFYASIVFAVIYLYRMFVAETLPDQVQELDQAREIAAIQQAEYLKNAANNIDETSVVMLDAAGISEGAALYAKNCVACHGDKGQGGVGPNLTDEFWLHKGSIKDVFYSIKYGWTEKGMKSWKDDFSPAQLAQLASYIKSLDGTKPAGGKEPQGEKYAEVAAAPASADATTN